MNLYENTQKTNDCTILGGEKIRIRMSFEDFQAMITTENVSEDPALYKKCAPLPAAGDAEGLKELTASASEAADAIREADAEIEAALIKRAEKVSEYISLSRALRVLSAGEGIPSVSCYDWTDCKAELEEAGKRNVVFAERKQNRVYSVEISAYHEKMSDTARLTYAATPALPALRTGYSVSHETKIPDYTSKENLAMEFDDMKAMADSLFFSEENPVIPRRFRSRLTVDGVEIPGYRYE